MEVNDPFAVWGPSINIPYSTADEKDLKHRFKLIRRFADKAGTVELTTEAMKRLGTQFAQLGSALIRDAIIELLDYEDRTFCQIPDRDHVDPFYIAPPPRVLRAIIAYSTSLYLAKSTSRTFIDSTSNQEVPFPILTQNGYLGTVALWRTNEGRQSPPTLMTTSIRCALTLLKRAMPTRPFFLRTIAAVTGLWPMMTKKIVAGSKKKNRESF